SCSRRRRSPYFVFQAEDCIRDFHVTGVQTCALPIYLAAMDQLRQGIFLRGYAGKNPKQEYKREAFALFQELLNNLQHEVVRFLKIGRASCRDSLVCYVD